jgi:hypothetical protein
MRREKRGLLWGIAGGIRYDGAKGHIINVEFVMKDKGGSRSKGSFRIIHGIVKVRPPGNDRKYRGARLI